MDFELPEELRLLKETLRTFVDRELIPIEMTSMDGAVMRPEIRAGLEAKAKKLGLWHLDVPTEYGGQGLNLLGLVVVWEESARTIALPPRGPGVFGPDLRPVLFTLTPAQKEKYGTGGLNVLRFEPSDQKMTRGAVAAVLVPGRRDSGGNQFFICITDQNALTGQYTVFARVVEGINIAQKMSLVPADMTVPNERIEVRKVTIRDTPAPEPEPFTTETVDDLSTYRAVIETSLGNMTAELYPDRAPQTVRNFLRLARSGVFDGTAFHRVVKGFVAQGGFIPSRRELLDEKQESYVRRLPPEFNATLHDRGTLSMARGDDPGSATTSFFIVLARTPALDKTYAAFGRVTEGLDVLEKIEAAAVNGEAPVTRIEVMRVRVITP